MHLVHLVYNGPLHSLHPQMAINLNVVIMFPQNEKKSSYCMVYLMIEIIYDGI